MEQAQSHSKAELIAGILDNLPELLLCSNSNGLISYASSLSKKITGYTSEELIGKPLSSLFVSSDADTLESLRDRLTSINKPTRDVLRLVKKDGSLGLVQLTSSNILAPNGDVSGIQSLVRDITEEPQVILDLEARIEEIQKELDTRRRDQEKLIQHSNFKNSIIRYTNVGISAIDRNLVFHEWNPAMESMTGIPAASRIGKSWKDVYKDYVGTEIYHQIIRVLSGETIEVLNKPFVNKKGFHNSIMVPLYGEKKEIIGMLALTYDITDHRTLNDKLRESERFLKKITEFAPNTICVLDLDKDEIIYANNAFSKVFQLEHKLSELTVERFLNLAIHKDDMDAIKEHYLKVREGRDSDYFEIEHRIRTKSGETRWFLMRSVVFKRDENGNVIQIMSNGKEITVRKKAEHDLIRSRDLLFQAQKVAKLGVWEWDMENRQVYWTEELYHIFGIMDHSKFDFARSLDFIHPDDIERVRDTVTKAIFNKEAFSIECRLNRQDGKVIYLLANGIPKIDESGNIIRLLGSALDITELRDTEALLKKKEEFLSVASHELKTPLTTAKAYIELVKRQTEKIPDKDLNSFVHRTAVHIDKLTKLISDLLDISKIQSGKMEFDFRSFDLDQMLRENIENLQATSTKHEIRFEGKMDIQVNGDKERLGQVIANLVTNAIKYSPNENLVLVKAEKVGNEVHVSVKDNGIGIPEESFDKIFDRFFREDAKRGHFQGLGIGLFISKEIIQRHDGKIWVESQPGKGSTFTFSLPI